MGMNLSFYYWSHFI